MMAQTTKLVAKAVLQGQSGKILVLRRSQTDTLRPGGTDFPGGGIEVGETLLDGVVREIKEEIGVIVDPASLDLSFAATSYHDNKSFIRCLFTGKIDETVSVNLSFEHDEYKWEETSKVIDEFDHPIWAEGLRYLQEHRIV